MPSLKKSMTRRWRIKYGGDRSAEMELREAIAFLFALRGAEYQKTHPSFVIPSVDEFFDYARQVNSRAAADIKTEKTPRNRPLRTISAPVLVHGGGRRRRAMVGGTLLDDFLRFVVLPFLVVGYAPCDSIMLCFNIVLYAVMAYKFTKVFYEQQALHPELTAEQFMAAVRATLNSREYANSFSDPVRWFVEQIFPILNDRRDNLMSALGTIISRFTEFLLGLLTFGTLTGVRSGVASVIGTAMMSGINLFFVSPFTFDSLVAIPLTCSLAQLGYISCGETCRKLIEKVSAQIGLSAAGAGAAGAGAGAR